MSFWDVLMRLMVSYLFVLSICLALPLVKCRAQELHSSTEPNAFVHPFSTHQPSEGGKLKEPVIPFQNLGARHEEQMQAKVEAIARAQELEGDVKGVYYESGIASYYSSKTHGRRMASGAKYDKDDLLCAHKTLPFGTRIRVVNKKNGKEVVVVVKDRGPFGRGRVIDLSNRAASELGMIAAGTVPCELWVLP